MSLLELRGVTASYGPVRVLHGIDLVVGQGELVVVLGANGAGKTTTLRAICGMVDVGGSITIDGTEVAGRRPDVVARHGVAHIPQGRGTFTDLTVEENLKLGAATRKDKGVGADMERWYEVFPRLAERRAQQAGSMSGGEQQMLAVARAMMSRPHLLLCDEPSLGLAPIVVREVFRRLQEANQESGTAILLVEQNANLALEVAQRAYVLESGRLAASGAASDLANDDSIRRAYLGA